MKRKYLYYFTSFLLAGTLLYSCSSDTPTPTVNLTTSNTGKNIYTLEIQALPSSSSQAVYTPINTGTVTVYANDSAKTANIVNGLVTFTNMPAGTVAGSITVPGYAFKNFTATIDDAANGNTSSNSNFNKTAVVSVFLPNLDCSVSGLFYADYTDGINGYQDDYLPDFTQYRSVQVKLQYADKTIEPNFYTSTTNKNGSFTLSNLPEGKVNISVIYYQQVNDTTYNYDTTTQAYDIPFPYQFVNTYSYSLDTTLTAGVQLELGSVALDYSYGGGSLDQVERLSAIKNK